MARIIQIRRDTSDNWSNVNPILAQGELGYEIDTGKLKIGDGTTPWNDLPYFGGGGGGSFIELSDTPDSYSGYAGKVVAVKSDETGLEFIDPPDEKVKASSSDSTPGYLTDKIDNITIMIDDNKLKFKDGCVIFPAMAWNTIQRIQVTDYKTGIIIPYYEYPYQDGSWKESFLNMLDIIKNYHNVPVLVVINPNNGPGTTEDTVWRRAIKMLHGAGAVILGYVDTNYATRNQDDVINDINTWQYLYPDVDGIFLDRMTNDNDSTHIQYYQQINFYCHQHGLFPTVGNAGSTVPSEYFLYWASDVIIIHENNTYPDESIYDGDWEDSYRELHYWRRISIVWGQSNFDKSQFRMLQKYNGFIFVTSSNDYSSLPDYLDKEFYYCSMYDIPDPKINDAFDVGKHVVVFDLQEITADNSTTVIDWNNGNKVKLTLTTDTTLSFINPPKSCSLVLMIQQDSNGGHSISFPSNVKFEGGNVMSPTTSPNAVDIVYLFFDGTNYYASVSYNFS